MTEVRKLACTADAPVCFFVSCRTEPTSCERDLAVLVVHSVGEMGLASFVPRTRQALSESQFLWLDAPAEKSREPIRKLVVGSNIVATLMFTSRIAEDLAVNITS